MFIIKQIVLYVYCANLKFKSVYAKNENSPRIHKISTPLRRVDSSRSNFTKNYLVNIPDNISSSWVLIFFFFLFITSVAKDRRNMYLYIMTNVHKVHFISFDWKSIKKNFIKITPCVCVGGGTLCHPHIYATNAYVTFTIAHKIYRRVPRSRSFNLCNTRTGNNYIVIVIT